MAKKHAAAGISPHETPPASTRERAVAAAMDLAAEIGWRKLSLAEVAVRAGMPLTELVAALPSKGAILDAYSAQIDQRMLEGGYESGEAPRDRLFETVMRRFEAMAPDRRALSAILGGLGGDPASLLCGIPRFTRAMALTLEAAGISSSGLAGMVRIKGLSLIYLNVMREFLDDDSADLSHTMAVLDKALRRAEGASNLLHRRRRAPEPKSEAGQAGA